MEKFQFPMESQEWSRYKEFTEVQSIFWKSLLCLKWERAGHTGYGEITWWSILAVQMRDNGSVLLRCLY